MPRKFAPVSTLREMAPATVQEKKRLIIRECIEAVTPPELDANVHAAAESLRRVLHYAWGTKNAAGKDESIISVVDIGEFWFHIWRRVARYGHHMSGKTSFYWFDGGLYRKKGAEAEFKAYC